MSFAEALKPVVRGSIDFRRESYEEIIGDIKALLPSHWRELALYQDDITLDPQFEMYKRAYDLGMVEIFSLRIVKTRELVGYAIYFVRPHLHYQNHKWAMSDIYWLHPAYRNWGVGRMMFEEIEKSLKASGVSVMHTTMKLAHPAPAPVLEALGHEKVEVGYSKRLV